MPRKRNRTAARYVANVGVLWDRRRVDRKAHKKALVRQDATLANPRKQHLAKPIREQMLRTMISWSFDHQVKAFVPKHDAGHARSRSGASSTSGHFEELLDAIVEVRSETVVLRISDLTMFEAARVRGYLADGSVLVQVNPRLDGPVTTQRVIRMA